LGTLGLGLEGEFATHDGTVFIIVSNPRTRVGAADLGSSPREIVLDLSPEPQGSPSELSSEASRS